MQEIKTYKTRDLVLSVSKKYDPIKLDLDAWQRFLDVLTVDRTYQVEAIRTAIIYLASGRYTSIEDLIVECWANGKNAELRNRYRSQEEYLEALQLPHRLSGNIDIATGAGKSYVMYGIAQMALSIGLVDKVLVLCPGRTIERELIKKFTSLSGDVGLKAAIPEGSKYTNPRIIDANSTIKEGDICIENIHAIYEATGSSIKDSLWGQGERVLVLSDESHHIYNKAEGNTTEARNLKKWKEFLLSSEYNFRYMLGFTGTAYIDSDYFNDVIYRYSLRSAVDEKVVKMIDYVSKNENADEQVKFQEIWDNHQSNKDTYHKIKPLTILVTQNITNATRLATKLREFLIEFCHFDETEAAAAVMIVTSHKDHKQNVARLPLVDDQSDPTQFIVSVSMLTEGWDVKNVFQIVPWEDRAFNSKLLISQVLGRGLRVPLEYAGTQPQVRVFNHAAWSRNIRSLVDELLEVEMKLTSQPLIEGARAAYHFDLYNIDYDRVATEKESAREHTVFDYTKGYINLATQALELEKESEYTNLAGTVRSKNVLIHYNSYTVDEVVNKIYEDLNAREWEGKVLKMKEGEYTKNELPPKEEIVQLIRDSMQNVGIKGDRLDEKNRQKILSSFSTLLRKRGKTVINVRTANAPVPLSTRSIGAETISVGNLKNRVRAFYSDEYESELQGENLKMLQDIIASNEDSLETRYNVEEINSAIFRTPIDLVFVSHEPELKFVNRLVKRENAKHIAAWCKSRDQGFYSIEYGITSIAGKHSKTASFNPDFFIKIEKEGIEYIIVVETKADGDASEENKAKYRYAKQHFTDLNEELDQQGIAQKYLFHFLSPESYDVFFKSLRDGNLAEGKFKGELELLLEAEG